MPATRKPVAPPGFDMTRQEAADYLGVTIRAVESWAVRGLYLPYLKLGGRCWYRKVDLDDFIARSVRDVQTG